MCWRMQTKPERSPEHCINWRKLNKFDHFQTKWPDVECQKIMRTKLDDSVFVETPGELPVTGFWPKRVHRQWIHTGTFNVRV